MITSACENIVTSDDYIDLILKNRLNTPNSLSKEVPCQTTINDEWITINYPKELTPPLSLSTYSYASIPKLYTTMDTTALTDSGITKLWTNRYLNLTGEGVLIGIVDTGIDYTHNAFIRNNRSKILSLWDQTISGTPPDGFLYGTEYTSEIINEALAYNNPYTIVKTRDTYGHGTHLAGVVCGYPDESSSFSGGAYESELIVVKLKEAKNYLREYFLADKNALLYQENDIMLGVKYLYEQSKKYQRPMVILIGLGTTYTGHNGASPLESYLNQIASQNGYSVIVASGNEGNERHHVKFENTPAEINVEDGIAGFTMEAWVRYPDIYSLEIRSPLGNIIPATKTLSRESRQYTFTLESTRIIIDYLPVETVSGEQVIVIRFIQPTPGVWTITPVPEQMVNGTINMWLPARGLINGDVYFLSASPYTTLTSPSTAPNVITVGGYNHKTDSLYIASGRGPTASGLSKPDIVAPCVNIWGPLPGMSDFYGYKTGTSEGAALTAAVAACLLEWGLVKNNLAFMNSSDIKSYLIKGAKRTPFRTYPSSEWGYGTLDAFNIFTTF